MKAKLRRSRRPSRRLLIGVCLLLLVVGVAADGPVTSIAGVTQTNDSDTGNGERWGRPGGRTLTFMVGSTPTLATLFWGATAQPTASFNNSVNQVGETMTLSSFSPSQAFWTGSADLPLDGGGSITIPTRFTLTITPSGGSSPITTSAGGAIAGINLK